MILSGPSRLPLSGRSPQQLVILLHGYGADGDNLIDLSEYWSQLLPEAEFIAPNGPQRSEINPFGYQWFGLQDFSPYNIRSGLDSVQAIVKDYLQNLLQERNLTPANLAIVGFSQGTMVALDAMFSLPDTKAVVGFSGAFYPPASTVLPSSRVLLLHGEMDMVVPYLALEDAKEKLTGLNINTQAVGYAGLGHALHPEGIQIAGQFLWQCFNHS